MYRKSYYRHCVAEISLARSYSISTTAMSTINVRTILAILGEPEEELKIYALEILNEHIDVIWADIAGSIPDMYVLL